MKANVVFITGGARSGKSRFALSHAAYHKGRKAFVATMQALDEETKERIAAHRKERGPEWSTFEEPLEIAALLRTLAAEYDVAVIDCLTLWVSNLMHAGRDLDDEFEKLLAAISDVRSGTWIYIVTNEVGMGIVPDNELARRFRDAAGRLNQLVARAADEACLMVAGHYVKIK